MSVVDGKKSTVAALRTTATQDIVEGMTKICNSLRMWRLQQKNSEAAAGFHGWFHNSKFDTAIAAAKAALDEGSRRLRQKVRDAARLALAVKMLKNVAWNARTKRLNSFVTRWQISARCEQQILVKSSEAWFEKGFMPVPMGEWHESQKVLEEAEGLVDRQQKEPPQ